MALVALTDLQEAEILRLWRVYRSEAIRCAKARAYLAACVMAAAELEAALMVMVNAFPEEAATTDKLPRRKGTVKPLMKWDLAELLGVAKAAGWLPFSLELTDDWIHRKANVGDYAEVVRQLRNLLHAARYAEDHFGKRVTKKHLGLVFDTIDAANSFLAARVDKSLREHIKAEGISREDRSRDNGSQA